VVYNVYSHYSQAYTQLIVNFYLCTRTYRIIYPLYPQYPQLFVEKLVLFFITPKVPIYRYLEGVLHKNSILVDKFYSQA